MNMDRSIPVLLLIVPISTQDIRMKRGGKKKNQEDSWYIHTTYNVVSSTWHDFVVQNVHFNCQETLPSTNSKNKAQKALISPNKLQIKVLCVSTIEY